MHDGEWHPLKKKDQRTQCCDCGLTHVEEYRIVDNGIEVRVWVDHKATYARRKRMGIKIAAR
jgi:transposase